LLFSNQERIPKESRPNFSTKRGISYDGRTTGSQQVEWSPGRAEDTRGKGDLRPKRAASLVNRPENHPEHRRTTTLRRNDHGLHGPAPAHKSRGGRPRPRNRLRKMAPGPLAVH